MARTQDTIEAALPHPRTLFEQWRDPQGVLVTLGQPKLAEYQSAGQARFKLWPRLIEPTHSDDADDAFRFCATQQPFFDFCVAGRNLGFHFDASLDTGWEAQLQAALEQALETGPFLNRVFRMKPVFPDNDSPEVREELRIDLSLADEEKHGPIKGLDLRCNMWVSWKAFIASQEKRHAITAAQGYLSEQVCLEITRRRTVSAQKAQQAYQRALEQVA